MTALKIRLGLLLAAAGAILIGWAAPHAHADAGSDFLDQLTAQGIYYRDRPGMLNDGKLLCGALRDTSGKYTTASIMGDLVTAGFTTENAARVLLTAARTLCPEQEQRLQNEANAAERPKMNAAI